jgi:hypothetical protein
MAPRITKQTKVILKDKDTETHAWSDSVSSHLTLAMDPVSYTVSILFYYILIMDTINLILS